MKWRRSRLAQFGLAGILGVLVFPGAGSARVPQYTITLTSSGPSPKVLKQPAGYPPVWFANADTETHSVTFANGKCSIQVDPDTREHCGDGFADYVGQYDYTVDGTDQAQLIIEAIPRRISLNAG